MRGLDITTEEYEHFSRRFCDRFHRVAARDKLREKQGDGFTAKAPEANITLLVHSEGTYQPFDAPDLAFFYCLVAPEFPGGEGTIVDGRLFLEELPPDLRDRFEMEGVIFESFWEPERWQAEFGIDTRTEFEFIAGRHPGLSCTFEGDYMRYRCSHSAIQPDRHGKPVFANAILAHLPAVSHPGYKDAHAYVKESNKVYFGNGELLSEDVVNTLIDIQDAVAYDHRLQAHDLLIIDNSRVMHGRRRMRRDCPRVLLTRFGFLQAASNEVRGGRESAQQAL